MTTQNELAYWLAAVRMPGIGPVKIQQWLTQFGSLPALFAASTDELQQAGLTRYISIIKNPDWQSVETELAWLEKNHATVIVWSDKAYPRLLAETDAAPLVLYAQGDVSLLHEPQIAIVGTRNPTPVGKQLAEEFARAFSKAGLIVTSGLAAGIDAASHRGALAESGKTIAVMGTGLGQIYPPRHEKLASEISQHGLLITEFFPNTPARAQNFPARNRIISGLSLGVLVVEAAARSGSLITARLAAEQNREVFAIPGSIHNPLARGCHYLVQQGAKLVETVEDVLEELRALNAVLKNPPHEKTVEKSVTLDKEAHKMLSQIGYEVTAFDAIIARTGLTAGEVSSMLLSLELEGHVCVVPGGYVRNRG